MSQYLNKAGLFFILIFLSFKVSAQRVVVSPQLCDSAGVIIPMTTNGDYNYADLIRATAITMTNSDGSIATTYTFSGGDATIKGNSTVGKILSGGNFDANTLKLFRHSKGKEIFITFSFTSADGIGKRSTMVFTVI